MASDPTSASPAELYDSAITVPSDSENYSANHELSSSVPSTTSSLMMLYKPPSVWGLLRGAVINLFLPFVNGLMLGFGELFAHEAAFRLGWSNTKVWVVLHKSIWILWLISCSHYYRSSPTIAAHMQWAPVLKCGSFLRSGDALDWGTLLLWNKWLMFLPFDPFNNDCIYAEDKIEAYVIWDRYLAFCAHLNLVVVHRPFGSGGRLAN